MKMKVLMYFDWLSGHIRSGHLEGIVDIPDKDVEIFKENPEIYLEKVGRLDQLNMVVDDVEVEDYGEIIETEVRPILD